MQTDFMERAGGGSKLLCHQVRIRFRNAGGLISKLFGSKIIFPGPNEVGARPGLFPPSLIPSRRCTRSMDSHPQSRLNLSTRIEQFHLAGSVSRVEFLKNHFTSPSKPANNLASRSKPRVE